MARKQVDWKQLETDDKQWIAKQIKGLLPDLRSTRYREWAKELLDDLLWFWTADAVHPKGHIRRDAIKHDPRFLRHTSAALKALQAKSEKVQHEHASEKAAIIAVLEALEDGVKTETIVEILTHLNMAVLVTVKEHRGLPSGKWSSNWKDRDPMARYKAVVWHEPTKKKTA